MPTNFDVVKRAIMERHLEQLSHLNLVQDPLESLPIFADFNDLVQWTTASRAQITAGKADRVYGGPIGSQINFNNAFLAFLESAAMYLRDTSKVVQAVREYRSGNAANALNLLENSVAQITALAAMWDMDFIQICDFVTLHPDGARYLVGPFCGAFFPKEFSTNGPFIGVAFKGTSVIREVINDLMGANTTRASTGRLWGSQVSRGFYYPMFSTYGDPSRVPFVMIQKAVHDISLKAKTTAVTHVTGHSLGGAYSSLCYAQLCIDGFGTPLASLGDLYTFGSPRVGRGDFAQPFKAAVSPPAATGSSWRIVNNRDYVPEVPASPVWPFSRDPFIHTDSAYKIYPDKIPVALPSEIGKHPTWAFPTAIAPHYTTEYYKSLTYATTRRALAYPVVSWGTYPLAVSTPSGVAEKTVFDDTEDNVEITVESIRGHTVGTIRYLHYFAEITATGVLQSKLNRNPKLSFDSLQTLYEKDNQCIFSKENNTTLKIALIVDKKQVAVAYVSTESGGDIGEVALTRGSCFWTFYEDQKVDDIEASIIKDAKEIFNKDADEMVDQEEDEMVDQEEDEMVDQEEDEMVSQKAGKMASQKAVKIAAIAEM